MNASDLSLISSIPIASFKQSVPSSSGENEKTTTAEASQPAIANTDSDTADTDKNKDSVQLSDKAKALLRSLQARDQQVRAHEQAHLAASGGLATSGASYTYQRGPDGVSYAVGGEVSIDVSAGRTPEETIARAITIRAAALAPADPSGQDLAVAAAAGQLEQQARGELQAKSSEELQAKLKSAYEAGTTKSGTDQENIAGPNTRIDELA
jgi:hypothetical protein